MPACSSLLPGVPALDVDCGIRVPPLSAPLTGPGGPLE
jgi:hypothetical protein